MPIIAGTAVLTGPAPSAVLGAGANFYQIRYAHALSKRTEFAAGYSRISNKLGAAYNYSDLGVAQALGQRPFFVPP